MLAFIVGICETSQLEKENQWLVGQYLFLSSLPLHIYVYFPFHFILTLPPFFHPTSPFLPPFLPSILRARSLQTCRTGFFGIPRTHKHTVGCQHTLQKHSSAFQERVLVASEFSRKRQKMTNRQWQRKKRQMKRGSELEGCAFLWLAWLESARDVLLAVRFIIPKPYGLASVRGVVGYICVCVCLRACACICVSG